VKPNPGKLRTTAETVRQSAVRRRGPDFRAMLCLAVPLLIGLLAGHPAEGAQATFGGLAGLYVPDSPYRYRARAVAAVGAALTLAVFLGAITGSNGWGAALTAGMFAGTASFICQTVELPPPRELMFVMALLAATALPGDASQALQRAAVTAAGAMLAWVISMAPALLGRDRPETITIAAALSGIADLVDRIGSGDEPAARHTAVNRVRQARLAVEQAGRTEPHRLTRIFEITEDLLEAALRSTVEETTPADPSLATSIRATIPLIAPRGSTSVACRGAPAQPEQGRRRQTLPGRIDAVSQDRPHSTEVGSTRELRASASHIGDAPAADPTAVVAAVANFGALTATTTATAKQHDQPRMPEHRTAGCSSVGHHLTDARGIGEGGRRHMVPW